MDLRKFKKTLILLIPILTIGIICINKFNKIENSRVPSSIDNDEDCVSAILNIINSPKNKIKNIGKSEVIRYPKDYSNIDQKHIQYGFEVEYTMEESDVIFKNFMPDKSIFLGTREDWLKMSHMEQLRFFDRNYDRIFPLGSRQPGRMVKITQGYFSKYISDKLICDSGNFELIYEPFDSLEELFATIKNSKRILGAGSMQVMISNPIEKTAYRNNKKLFEAKIEEEVGYYNFVNELDTLEKLSLGYARYKENSDIFAASSFNHPWLGPMTKLKNTRLKKYLELTYLDNVFLDDHLKDYAHQVTSNKFIGGLAFRPDIAIKNSRVASEVRDCHRNIDCIENRVKRETLFLMHGKSYFKKFYKLEPFDTMTTPYKLENQSYELLKDIFPEYNSLKIEQLQLYRNFTYPLRNWMGNLKILEREDLVEVVHKAQNNYAIKLKNISNDYFQNKIDVNNAKKKVMGALVEFANESKLYEAFQEVLLKQMSEDNFRQLDGINLSYIVIPHYNEIITVRQVA